MSIRRQIRLRKEFLHKKLIDTQEVNKESKKRKLQDSLDSDKPIPTELAGEARSIYHDLEMEVNQNGANRNIIDDEYANIGTYEPKVCITSSRDPSSKLKQFVKEVKLIIPNSQVINRGNHRTDELVEACRKADFTDVIILTETRGMPDGMIISHLPFGPTAYFTLTNTVMRHDIADVKPASQAYPHLIFEGLNSRIGLRITRILQALYPVPKLDSSRVITFANSNDYISFRHHMFTKEEGKIKLNEAGPRFEMLPYEVKELLCLFVCFLFLFIVLLIQLVFLVSFLL
jgi:U3 small nucleolar ribonucleoprotein protein IMP4